MKTKTKPTDYQRNCLLDELYYLIIAMRLRQLLQHSPKGVINWSDILAQVFLISPYPVAVRVGSEFHRPVCISVYHRAPLRGPYKSSGEGK